MLVSGVNCMRFFDKENNNSDQDLSVLSGGTALTLCNCCGRRTLATHLFYDGASRTPQRKSLLPIPGRVIAGMHRAGHHMPPLPETNPKNRSLRSRINFIL
ncbi:hypothetical protein L798_07022 [Zootermopsis nevadensis]|uniref:Uncharacterized protein n=1 Tax=Zootermopsis nevadensis TaxID=136037 RepID=A0A067R5V6_ZOONE|nr:hypothetical protein L798_07022 [Zootermopsis nevadensis]